MTSRSSAKVTNNVERFRYKKSLLLLLGELPKQGRVTNTPWTKGIGSDWTFDVATPRPEGVCKGYLVSKNIAMPFPESRAAACKRGNPPEMRYAYKFAQNTLVRSIPQPSRRAERPVEDAQ